MVGFWIIGAIVTYLLLNVQWFMETVGFLGVFTEAMLGELDISVSRKSVYANDTD